MLLCCSWQQSADRIQKWVVPDIKFLVIPVVITNFV